MKNHRSILLAGFLLALLCCTSCRQLEYGIHLNEELERQNAELKEQIQKDLEARKLDSEVRRRFARIRQWINDRKLDEAEDAIEEMASLKDYEEEIEGLRELVKLARKLNLDMTKLALDRQVILNESIDKQRLPEKYGQTIHKEAPTPYKGEPSALEKLLEKRVSMQISNMSVEDFAMQLGTIDGLNVADPTNIVFSNEAIKSKTFSANFKDVPLKELFAYISKNLGVDFNVVDNLIWITAAANTDTGIPLETQIIPLHHGIIPNVPEGIAVSDKQGFSTLVEADDDLETALKTFYANCKTGGSYTIFRTRNMLLINDTRANIHRIEELVKILDKPPYQVLIEARFLKVSQSDLRDIGVELKHRNGGHGGASIGMNGNTYNNSGDRNANISDFVTELAAITTGNPDGYSGLTISGIIGNRTFDLLISAIEKKQSTVNIAAPRVATLNNRSARIRKGDKHYYFQSYTIQSVNRGDNNGVDQILVPSGTPTALPVGITFDVKANVGNDGKTILLGLKPEIIDFEDWEDYNSSSTTTANNVTTIKDTQVKLPLVHEQTIAASVAINSGETVILGGMVENTVEQIVHKVPFLGDLPFIGFLFRHTTVTNQPSNLLIFVTATVIDSEGKYIVIDEEENPSQR